MQEQIDQVEFVVNTLEEIGTLLDVWDGIAGGVFRRGDLNILQVLELARYALVGIDRDKGRKPGREVFLVITAPRAMLERLFKTLGRMGLKFTKQVDKEGLITRCRLVPAAPPPEQVN